MAAARKSIYVRGVKEIGSPIRRSTVRNYELGDVVSALQKAVRRGDAKLAGYWAIEMFESGFTAYCWRRMIVMSAEDCWGVITHEIEALARSWEAAHKHRAGRGRIFVAKAAILLAMARKSRDADHLTNLVYDQKSIGDDVIEQDITEARKTRAVIPDEAFDCHTNLGRKKGKTKRDFFLNEHDGLQPKMPGLLDDELEKVRNGKVRLPHKR